MDIKEMLKSKLTRQQALVDLAITENRAMSVEEQSEFDTLNTEIANLEKTIEAQAAIEARKTANATAVNEPLYAEPKKVVDKFNSFGEQLNSVIRANQPGGSFDNRLIKNAGTGLNETLGSDGGFLVQTDFATELIKKTYENSILATMVEKTPISANANGLKVNAIDETSRVNGSRYGGVQSFWLAEGGLKTPSQPTFRQIELKLKKLIGLCYLTDELVEDTVALEFEMSKMFSEEFGFQVDDAIYRGDGAAKPLGILNSPALVTVAAEAGQLANTLLYENVVRMWSRMWAPSRKTAVWFINQELEPQLFTMSLAVGVAGVPVYLPASGASGMPYGTLMGRPVIPIEQTSALSAVGDIMLANLKEYKMIDKGDIRSASSIHVNFLRDEQAMRFVYRCDGQPRWNAPLTPASGSANTLSPFVTLAAR